MSQTSVALALLLSVGCAYSSAVSPSMLGAEPVTLELTGPDIASRSAPFWIEASLHFRIYGEHDGQPNMGLLGRRGFLAHGRLTAETPSQTLRVPSSGPLFVCARYWESGGGIEKWCTVTLPFAAMPGMKYRYTFLERGERCTASIEASLPDGEVPEPASG